MEALLRNEALTNIADNKGCYPLHLAAWKGDEHIVKLLIHQGPSHPKLNEQVRRCIYSSVLVYVWCFWTLCLTLKSDSSPQNPKYMLFLLPEVLLTYTRHLYQLHEEAASTHGRKTRAHDSVANYHQKLGQVPFSSILCESWHTSTKLSNSHQNFLDAYVGLQIRGNDVLLIVENRPFQVPVFKHI